MKVRFKTFLPIDPLPCPRPRVTVIRGHGVAYYPVAYKKWVAAFVALFQNKTIVKLDGPVEVKLCFDVRKARTSKLLYPGGDLDNYEKAVLDGLTKVGMWGDDKQVIALSSRKRFAIPDPVVDTVGIHIEITSE